MEAESLVALAVEMSEESEAIEINQLWGLTLLDAEGNEITLSDPVFVTIGARHDVLLGISANENESPSNNEMIDEETRFFALGEGEDGLMAMVESSYVQDSQAIQATLEDLSLIGLGIKAQALATNLQSLVIYPNPFRLETNTSGDQRMKLDNLTADAKVEVYNALGEKVIEAQITNNAGSSNNAHFTPVAGNPGRVAWDLRNAGGQRVASGVYVVVVSNSAGERVIKKVSVIW